MENICNRTDCFAYNTNLKNNCNCLSEVYKDDSKCSFYKEKIQIKRKVTEHQKHKLNELKDKNIADKCGD